MRFQLGDLRNTFEGFSRLVELAAAASELWFDDIEVDCVETSWLDANMCAPLGAILYKISGQINDVKITNLVPSVKRILCKNGFLSTYGEEQVRDTYVTTITYTRFEPKDDRYFASYIERHYVGKGMPRMSFGLEKRLRESIYEIFNNAVLHSRTTLGIFACGQYFPNKKRLDFSIADLGDGIRQVVNDHIGLDLTPEEAICWATNDQNTTKQGNVPGGLGLKLLKEFILLNGGRIEIASDRGYWEYQGGKVSTKRLDAAFTGTVVNIDRTFAWPNFLANFGFGLDKIPVIDSQSRILTKRQYIEYLIATCTNYTCTNLSDHLDGKFGTSHDAISDYLRREKLTPRQLWALVSPLIDDGESSYLVLDDSVQNKEYSKCIELVKLQYSGAEHGLVRGIDIVNLIHTNGKAGGYYPIDYRIYDPASDGKTKNDHFQEMVMHAIHDKLIKAKTILFDSWYASAENLKLMRRMGLFFVTTLKSNRLVSPVKGAGNVHLEQIEWTDDDLANGILVHVKAVPFLVRLFKIVATNGDVEWMITNKETKVGSNGDAPSPITTQDVQNESAVRWQVEQMHRELKQLVGTEKCQCRKARSQRNHMACCYQAWLAIKVAAMKKSVTLYEAQADLLREYLKGQLRSPGIPAYGC